MRKYFLPGNNSTFITDDFSPNYDWVYDYLDHLLHKRLWVDDAYRPYSAIGTVRLTQYRVQNECDMDSSNFLDGKFDLKPCKDLSCF